MDKTLTYKLDELNKALVTLDTALRARKGDKALIRDATVQRFEYSFELCWKTCKIFLLKQYGVGASSPKECFRALRAGKFVSDAEAEKLLKMTDDRNVTTHTYDEVFAKRMVKRIKNYYTLMYKIAQKIQEYKK